MNPSKEELEYYREAGQIASKVRNQVPNIVKPGKKILEVCEEIENMIFELGGKLAFPCNIGINEVTAHFTPLGSNSEIIPNDSIVKIDLGVHLNGYIADTAISISFNPVYESMIIAVEGALRDAIENIEPGIKVSDIGYIIEKNITRHGYKPIRNLTGHKIGRFSLHGGKAIPNIAGMNGTKIENGEVFAIEPFLTYVDASGIVKNNQEAYIFRFNKEKGAKSKKTIKLLRHIRNEFLTLPFTTRWLENFYPEPEVQNYLIELVSARCIIPYHVLIEESHKPVAQAEHTVIVNEDGCEVLTL
jgi:methionyl aminopeptidase